MNQIPRRALKTGTPKRFADGCLALAAWFALSVATAHGQFGRRNSDAVWSPDGKQIVFTSDRG